MKKYDFVIVGAGLYGAVFAREMANVGKRCLVIDKRKHTGGNTYCENVKGINVHKYGPHIFHTNDKSIWDYVNSFVKFNNFIYSPLAHVNEKLYNLPLNMNTFYQLWNVHTPNEAKKIIKNQILKANITHPKNLEEYALSIVGEDIYQLFIKGYTEKQWGRNAIELPAFLIKRLPLRFTYDNNYFNDRYQGIPVGGYNILIQRLLEGIEVKTGIDYFNYREQFMELAEYTIYTGKIDEYYNYRFGYLQYRSLRFEQEILNIPNFQGVAAVNYTEKKIPFTRIVEHKHFEFGSQPYTVLTREYPIEWQPGDEAYYPINDKNNQEILQKYKELSQRESNVAFGGRLAEYKYYDMHQVIGSALKKARYINRNSRRDFHG